MKRYREIALEDRILREKCWSLCVKREERQKTGLVLLLIGSIP